MKKYIGLLIAALALISCTKAPDSSEDYLLEITEHREDTERYMEKNPNSPFNYKDKVEFHGLNFFEPDTSYIFESRLHSYAQKDTITILGTKGEERKMVEYGYLSFIFKNKERRLNVYKSAASGDNAYYSIMFTDETTGDETYGVGRYLNFEKNEDPNHIYTIDFNYAYNPYCAYNPAYTCAVPRSEDHLDFPVLAGEKKYHD